MLGAGGVRSFDTILKTVFFNYYFQLLLMLDDSFVYVGGVSFTHAESIYILLYKYTPHQCYWFPL